MNSATITGYDIIGDVHGHADALEALLGSLGYVKTGSTWGHPERQAVFVGDLIDRGAHQIRTVQLVRSMRPLVGARGCPSAGVGQTRVDNR